MALAADYTLDAFLGGRLTLAQPIRGLRAGSDAIFLAAAVPASGGQRLLEVGAGMGAASLALLARVPNASIVGLEIDAILARLSLDNAIRNAMADRFAIIQGDVRCMPLAAHGFDHVFANPPFFDARQAPPSALAMRARVRTEERPGDLGLWIAAMAHALKPGGSFTLIHRAERLDEALNECRACDLGEIRLLPLTARPGNAPKRYLIQAWKNAPAVIHRLVPLYLHGEGHGYRAEAEMILRHGQGLDLSTWPLDKAGAQS